ncbi:hypothetical protein L218DRAFT_991068 [Marasmius fiardii PR-910]|nr:hypothetical protein L218DRAFT_991068 [Marasmius fiardii PR-910]
MPPLPVLISLALLAPATRAHKSHPSANPQTEDPARLPKLTAGTDHCPKVYCHTAVNWVGAINHEKSMYDVGIISKSPFSPCIHHAGGPFPIHGSGWKQTAKETRQPNNASDNNGDPTIGAVPMGFT